MSGTRNHQATRSWKARAIAWAEAFHGVHTWLGLVGNVAFLVGSVFFLFESLMVVGTWLFIVGALGMLLGSIGDAVARAEDDD